MSLISRVEMSYLIIIIIKKFKIKWRLQIRLDGIIHKDEIFIWNFPYGLKYNIYINKNNENSFTTDKILAKYTQIKNIKPNWVSSFLKSFQNLGTFQ